MPETAYYGVRPSTTMPIVEEAASQEESSVTGSEKATPVNFELPAMVPKQSFLQSLKFWDTTNPYVSLKASFLRPFILIA